MDEEIRKEKYRCTFNGQEGITFVDLYFKSSNPFYNKRAVLKNGEYLLTELLDFEDLKKSRTSGALNAFIKMGWVAVENTSISTKSDTRMLKNIPEPSRGVSEIQSGAINSKNSTDSVVTQTAPKGSSIGYPTESQPKVVELVSAEQSRTPNSFAISEDDAAKGDSFAKFNTLKYFQKLKAIKDMTDISLLEAISTKSTYPQLVHNSKNRLREMLNSK